MAVRVGVHEAKTRLSEYLNRAAYRGERIVVERHGKPIAALVSLDDLRRLEDLDRAQVDVGEETTRLAVFRSALAAAGIVVVWPAGPPVLPGERVPLVLDGPPLSEQIIRERR